MIEAACIQWLRFEKKCPFVVRERTPKFSLGRPDIIGVSRARHMTEIEVKRTLSDFKANGSKRCVETRDHYLHHWPRQFYFAVPEDIVSTVMPILPEWAGLLCVCKTTAVVVIKKAPLNNKARRLSLRECVRMAEIMGSHIANMEITKSRLQSEMRTWCHSSLDETHMTYEPDFNNYQI